MNARQLAFHPRDEVALDGRSQRHTVLFIDAQQLLSTAMGALDRTEQARLDGSWPARIGEHRTHADRETAENFAQQLPIAIAADDAGRADLGAERAQICHHEARVTGFFLAPRHAQNRDRRFGRDA